MKKILTVLLFFALVFALTACNGGGGGGGTTSGGGGDTSAPADTAAPTEAPPTEAPGGVEARTFDFGVLKFTSMEFTVDPFRNFCIGENVGDEKSPSDARFGIQAPLQQTANMDGDNASRNPDGFIISENGDFWYNIDRIEAKFYIEDKGSEIQSKPEHYGYIQPYIQIGGGPEVGTKWEWWSPGQDGDTTQVNLAHIGGDIDSDILPDFGKDNVISITWNVSDAYRYWGETRGIPGDTSGEEWTAGNGLQKFGIQFGRSDDFFDEKDVELDLYVGWVDVEIFVKDMDKYNEYVEKCAELGFTADSDVKVSLA
ncbi:MAG: hypothetical protein LBI38_03830 [Oscillospiraceae bacterium]|jgi:predicted small secreted protein|nr:hypothetical protein [Oscillospiraceae bacterium]